MRYAHLEVEGEEITIIPLGDLHIGSPHSYISEAVQLIESSGDNVYFLFAGDVIDNALRDSISDIYEQTQNPHQALMAFTQLLDLAKGRVLGVVSGNHELRTKRRVGVDILELLCEERHIPYAEDILVLDIAVKGPRAYGSKRRIDYVIAMGHGYSNARTVGGKVNANARIRDVIEDCDVYITGHVHQPVCWGEGYHVVDKQNKRLRLKNRTLVIIPAWVGSEAYAIRRFYRPSVSGLATIKLSGKKHEVTATIVLGDGKKINLK